MDFTEELKKLIPLSSAENIDRDKIESLMSGCGFSDMKTTFQNPVYHAEGDVFTHTFMVCERLLENPSFFTLDETKRAEVFLAALLHDIGKPGTTVFDGEKLTSPHHASTGSLIAREFLWKDCGLCGSIDKINFRETVCAMVRHHEQALNLYEARDFERRVRQIASIGELATDFSLDMLFMLADADARGRITQDENELIEKVSLSQMIVEDCGCLHAPYPFPDAFTRHAYLSGRRVAPDIPLYDDSWGEVIMMSGLPGTGKDTFIKKNLADLPMISLDDIRREFNLKPSETKGIVIQTAKERAREFLRKKQPFIWNATNLTKDRRDSLISLFKDYGAKVRMIYLETDNETRTVRNASRAAKVPENVIERMRAQTVLPTPDEAHIIQWITT